MKSALVFFCSMLMLTASIAVAQEFKNITAEELQEKLGKKENILIVDTRTSQEYAGGHLPTAISIPPPQFRFIENQLPKDKNIPIAFYCRGYSWGLSIDAAVAAKKAGYTNVFIYRGGFPEWEARGFAIARQ